MVLLRVLIAGILIVLCESHLLGNIHKKLSRLRHDGTYSGAYNWEVTNFPNLNNWQRPPSIPPENIIIAEVDSRPNQVQNQRHPISYNQFYQFNPNVKQETWSPAAHDQKPQEETVVVVVYDDQSPQKPQPVQIPPTFGEFQGNYAPNNHYSGNNPGILHQIDKYFNQNPNAGRQPVYPQQYPNREEHNNNNNQENGKPPHYDSSRPNIAHPYPALDKPFSQDQPKENGYQNPSTNTNKGGPNYPNNDENKFVTTTSERSVRSSTEETNEEDFSIDVRSSFDSAPKKTT